uniref:Peptidase M23 n=1 Tax=Hydrogenobacter sp. TaxID=2152829 RepID=A0A7C2Z2M9_9AQUI
MRDYVSIIIAYHEGKPPKTIRIKKSYLKLAAIAALSLIIVSFISYLLNMGLIFERGMVLAEVKRLELERLQTLDERKRLEEERAKLSKRLKDIENKMVAIEDHLAKRGVLGKVVGVGGTSYKASQEDLSRVEFLRERSEYLLSTLKSIPMGYPVYGNITSHLGWRKNPFGKGYEFHSGIDIEAPYGSRVVATADGVVEMAGYYGDYGKAVLIKHPSGYMTLYGHLSEISVKAGQEVKAGQVIGKVGSTGRSTGPHLHYEVLYQGKLKNPMEYIVWR